MPINPATLFKILKTVGPVAAQYFGGRKQANTEAEIAAQRKADAEKQYEDLVSNLPQFGVADSMRQFLANAKQDPAADMNRQILAEQEASDVGALKAGGAKALLGGLTAAQRRNALGRMDVESRSFAQMQDALKTFAGAEQRAQDLQTAATRDIMEDQMKSAQEAAQYGQDVEDYMRRSKQTNAITGLSGLLGSAGDLYGALKGGGDGSGFQNILSSLGFNRLGAQGRQNLINSSIRQTPALPFGENGMITPGEFSHDTNPIDIMQDGAKIGEMTGGEAVLNPEQQEKVAKQSPYFRKLMREFAMKASR
jgi:hypothetical protein